MSDVYRTPGRPYAPACMHCMTAIWMAYDAMWDWFICRVCDEWVEPYWSAPSERSEP